MVASAQCLGEAQPLDGLRQEQELEALRHPTGEMGVEVGTTFSGNRGVLVGVPPPYIYELALVTSGGFVTVC